ncbi:MAG TPA: pitrilysin family protein [Pyrinomonadaceae bacterium]|nr:pitrilysin family protein [Pyrinomonadaceae bacterium]
MAETFQLPQTPIEQFTLSNGLRVILNQDQAVPVVSVAVYYDVGSRNERHGRTGFAHLFEHMMFQGSENVPKAAHFQYIFNAGGTMNGTTSTERTNYFETLPANHLPLALWLESDRMRSLKVTQENLDNQRHAVQEEKRLRYDNQPYVNAFLRINELIFKNPANAHSTIGSMEDLDDATIDDIREFFRIYYAPNNAVLSIAGDFEKSEARSLVEKYFNDIPSQPDPPPVDVSEPEEVSVREETFFDQLAPAPAFVLGWKIPARRTPDFYALSLAGELLFEGDSSRLYQKLVKGDESVVSIQGGLDERRGPSALYIFALPKPGQEVATIREQIVYQIRQLAAEGPSAAEMEKLRNSLSNDAVRGRQSTMYRAQRLAEYALYDGNPTLFDSELEHYLRVTPGEIKAAVARFLDVDDRVVLDIVPQHAEAEQTVGASRQASGEPQQPAAPAPQVPEKPSPHPPTPTEAEVTLKDRTATHSEQPEQPADTPQQTIPGSGPLHP